jgi:hypothetical protein
MVSYEEECVISVILEEKIKLNMFSYVTILYTIFVKYRR